MSSSSKSGDDRRCGAKTRAGGMCRQIPASGKQRCHYHGGAEGSGGQAGNVNGLKHGAHAYRVLEGERTIYARFVAAGADLLEEQALLQTMITRVLAAEQAARRRDGLTLDEIVTGGGEKPRRVRRRVDYMGHIIRLTCALAYVVAVRSAARIGASDPNKLFEDLRAFWKATENIFDPPPDQGGPGLPMNGHGDG
jgi:hypothetical protein